MTRNSLASAMAEHTYFPKHVTRLMVDVAIDLMAGAIARGEPIELRGFGRFAVKHTKAKLAFGFGNTPQTHVLVPARRVVRFKAHDQVLRALATGEAPPVTPMPEIPE